MPFTFETVYTPKTCAVMARVLRKTVRRKRSRRSRIFAAIVLVVGALLVLPWYEGYEFDLQTVITLAAMAVIIGVMLFEDQLNGYLAYKRMIAGTQKNTSVFSEEAFTTSNEVGTTHWQYDKIRQVARKGDYFVFLFDKNHAQVYDGRSLKGGSAEAFADFIAQKTGQSLEEVK